MHILDKIVAQKRLRLASAQQATPLASLVQQLIPRKGGRLYTALQTPARINIIAELKKASPSKSVIRADFDPVLVAKQYTAGRAAALSVLTEEDFFQGSLAILQQVRAVTPLPILRKDFLFDPYQIYEAAAAGADGFLLIAAILETSQMRELITLGKELGLDALVEVHTLAELEHTLAAGAEIVGVNNRNLQTFEVSLATSTTLAPQIPPNVVRVSESGLSTPDDLAQLRAAGFHAFLIGEHFMRADDPQLALETLQQTLAANN
jgi:indole-3-glycerol phosphate synthase